jgi:hypothetical protein
VLWPAVRAERVRAADFARRRLDALEIGRADPVMVTSMMSEAVQFVPLEDALRERGAVLIPADASAGDAGRVQSLVRMFDVRAVFGLSAATVDGLVARGDVAAFASVPWLAARPGAYEALREAGMNPLHWVNLGPSVALECPQRSGAHLDGTAWEAAVSADGVTIRWRGSEPLRGPCGEAGWIATGVHGRIVEAPCGCGSDDPRVVIP